VTQQLVPTVDGQGRVAAPEIMIATPGIRNLVREGKVHQIYSAMQAGGRYGMQTMDMSLASHVKAGRISQQMAFERCPRPRGAPALGRILRRAVRVLRRRLGPWRRRRELVATGSSERRTAWADVRKRLPDTYAYKVRDRGGNLITGRSSRQRGAGPATAPRAGLTPLEVGKQGAAQRRSDQEEGQAQGAVGVLAAVRHDDQLRAADPACPGDLGGSDQQQGARPRPWRVPAGHRAGVLPVGGDPKHPKVFNNLFVSMVKSGETGGSLDSVLLRLADMIENEVKLRGKIKSAMTYPIAVVALVSLILSGMLLFVVPQFKSIYSQLGGSLPLPTRLLLMVSTSSRSTGTSC
jgi:hypothetical protein